MKKIFPYLEFDDQILISKKRKFKIMSLNDAHISILMQIIISNQIAYYSCLTIVNLGFVTNILNIVICSRKSMHANTMGYYNILMSLFNILSFVCAYLLFFPVSAGLKDLLLESYYNCILVTYFTRVFIQMSSWLNVMVSIDRAICISFPHRFKFLTEKKFISCILIFLFVIICGLNVPNLFFKLGTQIIFISNETSNNTICGSSNDIILLKYTIIIVMRIVIPILLTVFLNIVLIHKLFVSRSSLNITRSLKKDYQFALTVIMLNFAYILTETPFLWGTINIYLFNNEEINKEESLEALTNAKLIFICTFMLSTYMFGSVFFVNLFFNKIFQKEIRSFFFRTVIGQGDILRENGKIDLLP